ncbi:MAG: branched-chain amino acid ABC transporter permease [Actinomycetota bacterium]|jgi:branched-chain amino acid transport system permease protein
MQQIINTILIGISIGSIYSLMALALVLVWRSTRVVNFGQAGQAIVSTYIAWEVLNRSGSYFLAFVFAVAIGGVLGGLIESGLMRTLFKHASEGPIAAVAPVIVTLGLLGVIRAVVGLIWTNEGKSFAAPVETSSFVIGDTAIPFSRLNLLIVVTAAIVMIIFSVVFQKTNLGLALRAAAYNPEIARLSGIRVSQTRTIGWVFAGAAGGVAGILVTSNDTLTPNSLDTLLVFAFTAAVIGGLESLVGAVVGGLVLGIGLSFILIYLGTSLVFPTAFIVLVLVLLIRPAGIFGVKGARSA